MAYIADEPLAAPRTIDPTFLQRLGEFSIDVALIDNQPATVIEILAGCLIVRAELRYDRRAIQYIAMHADFEASPPGQSVPSYLRVVTNSNGAVTYSWKRP